MTVVVISDIYSQAYYTYDRCDECNDLKDVGQDPYGGDEMSSETSVGRLDNNTAEAQQIADFTEQSHSALLLFQFEACTDPVIAFEQCADTFDRRISGY